MNQTGINTPQQIAKNMIQAGVSKTKTPFGKMVLVGGMIFVGLVLYMIHAKSLKEK